MCGKDVYSIRVSLQELLIASMIESLWVPYQLVWILHNIQSLKEWTQKDILMSLLLHIPESSATLIEFKPSDKHSNTGNYVY